MRYMEKHPMAMIVLGVLGISVSSILVKFTAAPAAVTAAWRLLWTVALLAAVAVAAYTLIGRVVRVKASTGVYTWLVYTACGAVLVVTCAVQGQALLGYGSSPILVGLALAVCSTILGHSIFSWCLKYFSPAFVSASKLCESVVAALLAAVIFAQIPTVMQLLGGGLILGGVAWYSRIEGREEKA